jgi:hypothetical protein
MAYERLNDANYPFEKIYLSNIISYLIGYRQRVFHCTETSDFEDWSTKEAWKVLQDKYKICFVNIDGIIQDKEGDMVKSLTELFNGVRSKKQSYIFFTSRNDIDEEAIKVWLASSGINCLGVVSSCPLTDSRVVVNSSKAFGKALIGV